MYYHVRNSMVLLALFAFFILLFAVGCRPATPAPEGMEYFSYAANPAAAAIIHSWSQAGQDEMCEVWGQGPDGALSVYDRFSDLGVSAVGLYDTVESVCSIR